MYPLISVVVPTIGRDTLERTLESIIDTKYPNLEIIISLNGCSLDKVKEIERKYVGKAWLVINKDKLTPAQAKNNGIRFSKGKYLTFLDDDDTCLPEKFFALSKYLEKHLDTFGAFGMYNVRDCYSNKIKNTNCGGCDRVCFDTLVQNNYIGSGSIMLRNSPIVRFDESLPYGWGEDYKLSLELLGRGYRIDFIPVPVYVWTQNLKTGYTATFSKKGIDWRQLTKNIQGKARKRWKI